MKLKRTHRGETGIRNQKYLQRKLLDLNFMTKVAAVGFTE